jgi:hypothetical protein
MRHVEGKITLHNPESIDEFNVAPKIQIWPEPLQSHFRPLPADFGKPMAVVVIFYITSLSNSPKVIEASTLPDEPLPVDVIFHIEKILERGTEAIGGEVGKLFNPLIDPLDPLVKDTEKFLNRSRPDFVKRSKRIIQRTKTVAWPLLVTYVTTMTRKERQLS